MGNPVPDDEDTEKLCICPKCPTFLKSKFTSNVFCARGKAKEKVKSEGCPCPNCPVYLQYSLNQLYYCIQGKSRDL